MRLDRFSFFRSKNSKKSAVASCAPSGAFRGSRRKPSLSRRLLLESLECRNLLAADIWDQRGGDAGHTSYVDIETAPAALVQAWGHLIGSGNTGHQAVAIDETQVYRTIHMAGGPNGTWHVVAYNLGSGDEVWRRQFVANAYEGVSEPSVADGVVYVHRAGHSSTGGGEDAPRLYALDAATGVTLLERGYTAQWGSNDRPAIADGQIVTENGYYGGIAAYDASDLTRQWFAGGIQQSQPAATLDDEYVYAYNNFVYRRSDGTRLPNITHSDFAQVTNPIAAQNGVILFDVAGAGGTFGIAAYDGDTHELLWTFDTLNRPTAKAVGGGVIAVAAGTAVILLDADSGSELSRWHADNVLAHEIILTRTHVFVQSVRNQTSTVHAVDLSTLQEAWTYSYAIGQPDQPVMEMAMGASGELVLSHRNFIRTFASELAIVGTDGDDTLVVSATSRNSGTYRLNGGPEIQFSNIAGFAFEGLGGNDTLRIINPDGTLFAPTMGIHYDGGGQAGDTLTLSGGLGGTGTFAPGHIEGGESLITLAPGGLTQRVSYTGLALVTDLVPANSLYVIGTPGSNSIELTDGVADDDGVLRLAVDLLIPIDFGNKKMAAIYGGTPDPSDLGDTILVHYSEQPLALEMLYVVGSGGNDVISITSSPTNVSTYVWTGSGDDSVTVSDVSLTAALYIEGEEGTDDLIVSNTHISGSRTTGLHVLDVSSVTIANSSFNYNGLNGIHLKNVAGDVTFTGVTANNNDALGKGLWAESVAGSISLYNSTFSSSSDTKQLVGVHLSGIGGAVTLSNTNASGNRTTGIVITGNGSNLLSLQDVTSNENGLVTGSGIDLQNVGSIYTTRVTAQQNRVDGLYIAFAESLIDVEGKYLEQRDGAGIRATAITGNVVLSKTTANDNSAGGAQFRRWTTDLVIGGNLRVEGGSYSDTATVGSQSVGIDVGHILGDVVLTTADDQQVFSAYGNGTAGVTIRGNADNHVHVNGIDIVDNGDDGFRVRNVATVSVRDAVVLRNGYRGLYAAHCEQVILEHGHFAFNWGGVVLEDFTDSRILNVQAVANDVYGIVLASFNGVADLGSDAPHSEVIALNNGYAGLHVNNLDMTQRAGTLNIHQLLLGSEATFGASAILEVATVNVISPDRPMGDSNSLRDRFDLVANAESNRYFFQHSRGSTSSAAIHYANVGTFNIETGVGADTVNISATAPTTQFAINTGSGHDDINVLATDAGSKVVIDGGDNQDTFNVLSTGVGSYLELRGGKATDTFNVGAAGAGTISGILGRVVVHGDGNNVINAPELAVNAIDMTRGQIRLDGDVLNINDQLTAGGQTYSLSGAKIIRTGAAHIDYGTIETVNIHGGSGANTYSLFRTNNGRTFVYGGEGSDTFNLSNTHNMSTAVIDGQGGHDTFNVAGTAARSVTHLIGGAGQDAFNVSRFGNQAGLFLSGGDGNDSFVVQAAGTTSALRIEGDAGQESVEIHTTSRNSRTDIHTGSGSDSITIGTGTLDGILGRINVRGGTHAAGSGAVRSGGSVNDAGEFVEGVVARETGDVLMFDDSEDANNDRYFIRQNGATLPFSIERRDVAAIEFSTIETVDIRAGDGNDEAVLERIANSGGALPFLLNFDGGAGVDRLSVYGTTGDDNITVGATDYAGVLPPVAGNPSRSMIMTTSVDYLYLFGAAGNDTLVNNSHIRSTISGGLRGTNGSDRDVLVGGSDVDIIYGGPDVDALFGRDGDDFLFADYDEQDRANRASSETLDGGLGTDSAIALDSSDRVLNVENLSRTNNPAMLAQARSGRGDL